MISASTGNLWNTGMLTGICNCPPIRVFVRYTYPYEVAHNAVVVALVAVRARGRSWFRIDRRTVIRRDSG
jgi:hypothetical protein